MPSKFMLKDNCLLHPSCRDFIEVNMVNLCYDCWYNASSISREKIKKATRNWSIGLYTWEDLNNTLANIATDDPAICASQEPEVEV